MTPGGARPGGHRVVLLRHAKAEAGGGVVDALRPLALAGRRQCAAVGARLAASGLIPERVLVSSAVRTRQTWELTRGAFGDAGDPDVDVLDELYDARVSDVLQLLRVVDERVATVLVVGHEPTMSGAAGAFALAEGDREHAAHLAHVHAGLSTGSYAVLEIGAWADLDRGTARIVEVVRAPH
ncbi:MAG: histidine phosphatase family protein [Cellulomonadaceae bacterium]|nr:histidine phosphatase family protein [Cellulomonadaceae bacterium]